MHNDHIDKYFDELLLAGAVEVSAINEETGEFLYSFTDKILDIAPELAEQADRIFHLQVMYLWEQGYLSMDVSIENPTVSLTDKSFDEVAVSRLSQELRQTLNLIINAMRI